LIAEHRRVIAPAEFAGEGVDVDRRERRIAEEGARVAAE